MNPTVQKILWIGLILAIALGLLWQFYPLQDAKQTLDRVPLAGPGFVGKDVPLSIFEEQFFKGVNVVKRVYRVDNANYFFTMLDGTHNRHIVHDPYYCFTGSGWDILSAKDIPIEGGTAKELVISKGAHRKSALFWFSNGEESYASTWKFWWQATLRRLSLGKSGPEPLLLMIQPLDNTTEVDWPQILKILQPVMPHG